jgi:hypothetical protein
VTVRYLLQRYKKCRNLLENDGGGGAVGGNLAVSRFFSWEALMGFLSQYSLRILLS